MCLSRVEKITDVFLPEVFTVYKTMKPIKGKPNKFSGVFIPYTYKFGWNHAEVDEELSKRYGYKLGFHAFLDREDALELAFNNELVVPIAIKRDWCTATGKQLIFDKDKSICFTKFYLSERDIENAQSW